MSAPEQTIVERALSLVAEFNHDPRCGLNCLHSESLAGEVIRLRTALSASRREGEATTRAQPFSEWHEDYGPALWWLTPVAAPPYSGWPDDSGWPFDDEDEAALWWTPLNEIANAVVRAASLAPTTDTP